MNYKDVYKGIFLERPNRFIARCLINGEEITVHVKNTGRCRELLIAGAEVYLEKSSNLNRKTQFDLIAVKKGEILINMDSQCPNIAAKEWLEEGRWLKNPTLVKPESKYGNSRIDFYLENESEKALVEVKGVTLEKNGRAMFPDAPTERGTRHVNELIKAHSEGYKTAVLFVIQMKGVKEFMPNITTDKAFAKALKKADESGVEILAYDCIVTPGSMHIDKKIPVIL